MVGHTNPIRTTQRAGNSEHVAPGQQPKSDQIVLISQNGASSAVLGQNQTHIALAVVW